MPARRAVLLILLALAGLVAYSAYLDRWGRPLGPEYEGPEVQPRPVGQPALPFTSDEEATIADFERTAGSVVFISNTSIRRDPWSFNLFEVPQGAGSGFVWNRQGHIVTNYHVIHNADTVEVTMANRKSFKARLVGIDPDHDLAVLQIRAPEEDLLPVEIGSSHDLRVGQKVLAIGNPFGLDHTLTTGVVSALGRTIKSMTNRTIEDVIQIDAAINPGNSGGPLLDSRGRLIGINTQIVSPSGAFAGIGFAVPVNTANRIVPDLIKYGKLIRPGLGVSIVADTIVQRWGIKGVVIRRVIPGSAAEQVGFKGIRETSFGEVELGDIIVGLAGREVEGTDDLLSILDRYQVGDEVEVEFLRNGNRNVARLTLQAID